jgi:hypothetical protein
LSILESSRHELRIAHGLTLMTPSPRGWEAFPAPGASPILVSLGPSHHRRHKSRASLRGPPCAHGVSGIPFGEVRDRCPPYMHITTSYNLCSMCICSTTKFILVLLLCTCVYFYVFSTIHLPEVSTEGGASRILRNPVS